MAKNSNDSNSSLHLTLGTFFVFALVLTAALFVYRKAIHSEFYYDDTVRITQVFYSQGKIHFEPLPAFQMGLNNTIAYTLPDRPLLMASIWANFIFGGADAEGYKITNIFLHAINVLLLFLFMRWMARERGIPDQLFFAILISFLFLAHPLNNQAVTMVIQRGVLLSSIFFFLAFFSAAAYTKGKPHSYALGSALFFLCGILSKPNILTGPLILVVLLAKTKDWVKLRRIFFYLAPICFVPAFLFMFFRVNFFETSKYAGNWLSYFLVENRVIFHYLRQVFWPTDISSFYSIANTASFSEVWPYLLGNLALLSCIVIGAKRGSLVFAFLFCFYLALIPESSVFPIPHVVFDHRMYFPLMFLCGGAYIFLLQINRTAFKVGFSLLLIGFIAFLAMLNDKRNFEIRTYYDWLHNSTLSGLCDHVENVKTLNMLLSLGKLEEGKKDSLFLHQKYPDIGEYSFFFSLFSRSDKFFYLLKFLDSAEAEALTGTTQANLVQYLINSADTEFSWEKPLVRLEIRQLILNTQTRHYSDPRFSSLLGFYKRNVRDLHFQYLDLANKGFLTPAQQELWVATLSIWKNQNFLEKLPFESLERVPYYTRYLLSQRPVFLEKNQP